MPRCKNCKEKFDVKHFNQKYCFKTDCVKEWVKTAKVENWKKTKKEWKQQDETVGKLIIKAQRVFNTWIRKRDEGQNCISCNKPPKKKNAGHYHSANKCFATRFDPRNVNLQCEACNNNLSGNLIHYGKNLKIKIGLEEYENLDKLAQTTRKFTRQELKDIIKKYKQKLDEL